MQCLAFWHHQAPAFRYAYPLMGLGVADVDAWRVLDDHPQLGLAVADLVRSAESGTSMVEGLQHHAAAAREARRGALQVRARAVGVQTIRF
jgi:hypothetical protein